MRKRDFAKTPEPSGGERPQADAPIFTVQRHDARRLHYDFRLELGGVLKSWAVPKGPSLDPADKRLAVETEDHPMDYATFEGTIPAGEYGAGTVEVWDFGQWQSLDKDPAKALARGKLKFKLWGRKLHGAWNLVRIHSTSERYRDGKNWLLIKEEDDDSIVVSVERMPGAVLQAAPASIRPQLATLVTQPPIGDDWLHEIKFDGYRLQTVIVDGKISLFTRQGNDWTDKFSEIAEAIARLPVRDAILDGEVVAMNSRGRSDFQLLQNSLKNSGLAQLQYYIFDLPFYHGYDLTQTPLEERKGLLAELLALRGSAQASVLLYSRHIAGQGRVVFEHMCELGLEGMISKKRTSPYVGKRSRHWLKIKCIKRQEFVIVGYTASPSVHHAFGALHVGFYDEDKRLQYAGKVGTGFTQATFEELMPLLEQHRRATCPLNEIPLAPASQKNFWLEPTLVAEVAFTEWTNEGRLRHPSFQGLREDKSGEEISKEEPIANVWNISNPDKVLYPEGGITKLQVANYYDQVAKWMLPELHKRLVSLVRCPNGYQGQCFFQKHLRGEGDGLEGFAVAKKDGSKEEYILVKNEEGLLQLVQLGVLEIHPWASKVDRLERPDRVTFDLDPSPEVPWSRVVGAAQEIKEHLASIGLQSFVRTTGGKGLHVLVPIDRRDDYDHVADWAQKFSEWMVKNDPDLYVATMSKALRVGKIFIDHFRNRRGSTSIASYSTRARANATVSVPLTWEELPSVEHPAVFTIFTVPQRLSRLAHDPWASFFTIRQGLNQQAKRLVGMP